MICIIPANGDRGTPARGRNLKSHSRSDGIIDVIENKKTFKNLSQHLTG
ncbi:hypothetical protein [Ginsengibacter hankyongi]|nr:hypothetical protein [Ginsengibacter hankyongi]